MLTLKIHNILDFVLAALIAVSPFIFGFSDIPVARVFFPIVGLFQLLHSLSTRYEFSVMKLIPMGLHMLLDFCNAILIFFGPYIFGYREALTRNQVLYHMALGLLALGLIAFTRILVEEDKVLEPKLMRGHRIPVRVKARKAKGPRNYRSP